jgi:hypothetical protein
MALGISKQLHNQVSYRLGNGLKLFRKAYSTNARGGIKNDWKAAAQAMLEKIRSIRPSGI